MTGDSYQTAQKTATRRLRRRTKKSGEDGSYRTAQVSLETEEERKARLKKIGSYHSAEVSPCRYNLLRMAKR